MKPKLVLYVLLLLLNSYALAGDRIELYRFGFAVADGAPQLPPEWSSTDGLPTGKAHYIIHLSQPMDLRVEQALNAAGLTLLYYVPQNSYVVSVTHPTQLSTAPFVDWFGRWLPAYKVHPSLDPFLDNSRAAGQILDISLHPGSDFALAWAQIEALGGQILDTLDQGMNPYLKARFSGSLDLRELSKLEAIRWISEPGERVLRNDRARWLIQSYDGVMPSDRTTPVYEQGLRGEGEVVGLIDGTPNLNLCFFEDPEAHPVGADHRKFVYFQAGSVLSHGTHVAGTLAGHNSDGSIDHAGIAYEARLAFSPLPGNQSGNLFNLFSLHASYGAAIHSNSWGENRGTPVAQDYTLDCSHIDQFSYQNEDQLVIFACENSSTWPLSTLLSPENSLNGLAIGASEAGDVASPETLAERHGSSVMGPVPLDLRRKPELFAPGCALLSADSTISCGVRTSCGTSMAAPVVAGAAALVHQYFREGFYPLGRPNPEASITPSGALMKAMLLVGSADMQEETETGPGAYTNVPIPNDVEGWGRVDLGRSLYFEGDREHTIIQDVRNAAGLHTGDTGGFSIENLSSDTELRVVLVFTQPPGVPGTLAPVTNDLNLIVTGPLGTVYLGNVFQEGRSISGGTTDPRNNVEVIRLPSPEVGTYTIQVEGHAVNLGAQGYAIVASGDLVEGQCNQVQLDAGSDVEFSCWGQSDVIGAGLPFGLEGHVSWTPTQGLSDPTARAPIATPEETTLYQVTATLPSGCIRQAEVLVSVPAMNINGDTSLNQTDFFAWPVAAPWGEMLSNSSYDYDGDGRATILDLLLLSTCL